MTTRAEQLNQNTPSNQVGFFPTESTYVTSYFDGTAETRTHPFMWIVASFDSTTLTDATLAVWDGVSYYDDAKTFKLVNPVTPAYSRQPIHFIGRYLVASGKDYLGNTVTASDIADFPTIVVLGGARSAS